MERPSTPINLIYLRERHLRGAALAIAWRHNAGLIAQFAIAVRAWRRAGQLDAAADCSRPVSQGISPENCTLPARRAGGFGEMSNHNGPGLAAASGYPMPNNSFDGVSHCGVGRTAKTGASHEKTLPSRVPVKPPRSRNSAYGLAPAISLYMSWKAWRNRRRTMRALAKLDERSLRDIGVTSGETTQWWLSSKSRRELANLDDSNLIHLSDLGRQRRREARHGGSDGWR
jgi:uncharacterized protein YjiS (DUF1127 family)